jgi:hypothetical protein
MDYANILAEAELAAKAAYEQASAAITGELADTEWGKRLAVWVETPATGDFATWLKANPGLAKRSGKAWRFDLPEMGTGSNGEANRAAALAFANIIASEAGVPVELKEKENRNA